MFIGKIVAVQIGQVTERCYDGFTVHRRNGTQHPIFGKRILFCLNRFFIGRTIAFDKSKLRRFENFKNI